jgi:hypothetical protein
VVSGRAELLEDALDVLLHTTLGDDKAFGDALIGAALSQQLKHLPFARSQLLDRFLVAATGRAIATRSLVFKKTEPTDPASEFVVSLTS